MLTLLSACGSPQPPTSQAAAPQSAPLTISRDAHAECPAWGKKYTTGTSDGRVSIGLIEFPVHGRERVYIRNAMVYGNWPKNRAILQFKPELLTCGPQSGQPALGEIRDLGERQYYKPKCDTQKPVCEYFYEYNITYEAKVKPYGNKPWEFDYVRLVPEKHTKGYGALPMVKIKVWR